jgi:hypothetical protein
MRQLRRPFDYRFDDGAWAHTARIVAVASDDKQNFRTLGMMSSLTAARLIGAMKVLHSPGGPEMCRFKQNAGLAPESSKRGAAWSIKA